MQSNTTQTGIGTPVQQPFIQNQYLMQFKIDPQTSNPTSLSPNPATQLPQVLQKQNLTSVTSTSTPTMGHPNFVQNPQLIQPPPHLRAIPTLSAQQQQQQQSRKRPLENPNEVLTKRKLQELVNQIDPTEKMDPDVEELLLEITDDFIESVTTFACNLAKHRKSSTLEVKDLQLHLERNWNIHIPGFGQMEDVKPIKKTPYSEGHKQRLALIKKKPICKMLKLTKVEVNTKLVIENILLFFTL